MLCVSDLFENILVHLLNQILTVELIQTPDYTIEVAKESMLSGINM
jgi:hypothetical protein